MKTVSVAEAKESLSEVLGTAQREEVLVLKHGKPLAIIVGVEGQDLEDLMLERDPAFWAMIRERRKEPPGPTLDQVEAELGVTSPRRSKRPRRAGDARSRAGKLKR